MVSKMRKAIFVLLFCCGQCAIYPNVITGFAETKSLDLAAFFVCSPSKQDRLSTNIFLRHLYVDMNLNNTEDYLNVLSNYNKMAMIVDGDCKNLNDILQECGRRRLLYETYEWLIFAQSQDNITNMFENVNLNINAEIHVAVQDQFSTNWTIFDVYNPASFHGGKLVITEIGYFNDFDGYVVNYIGNKYWRRRNMGRNVTFKSAIVVPRLRERLEDYLNSEMHKEIDSMHRFQSVTIRHCQDMYNFSIVVERTTSWGYIQKDTGRFDGLVSLLERRLIDFGSSPLIFKRDRMPVVDYSFGNWILKSTFLYRKPKIITSSYNIFLRPLSAQVWILMVIFLGIILVGLRLCFGVEEAMTENKSDHFESSWSILFLFTLGAVCQQGATSHPQTFSSRILSVFVFLFCILNYQFYSASIVSYILMDLPSDIKTLPDLVKSPLEAGIEDILIDRNYFVQTTDPAAIELFNKIRGKSPDNDTGFYDPEDGVKRVQKGGFAFHAETSTAYPIIRATFSNEQICELEEVQMYRTQPMHTNLQKHSPFREMLNYCMLRLVEDGEMVRLRKFWDAQKPFCVESTRKIEIHVGLKEFSCGIFVLTYGFFASFCFLSFEVLFYHYNCTWKFKTFRKR